MKTNQKNREQVKSEIRRVVAQIKIHPKGTPEGDTQRSTLKTKYGI